MHETAYPFVILFCNPGKRFRALLKLVETPKPPQKIRFYDFKDSFLSAIPKRDRSKRGRTQKDAKERRRKSEKEHKSLPKGAKERLPINVSTSDFQSEVGEVFGEIGGELPAKFGRRFSSFFC